VEITDYGAAADRDTAAVLLFTVFAGRQIVESPRETIVLRPIL
jgi:hypothetical protein